MALACVLVREGRTPDDARAIAYDVCWGALWAEQRAFVHALASGGA